MDERRLQQKHIRLGYLRLAFGVAAVVLLLPPRVYFLLPLAAFALAAQVHGSALRRLAETRRALAFHEGALARAEDRWSEREPASTRVDVTQSLYAADLDLFGPGSVFALLCEARTSLGQDELAGWLLQPGAVATVQQRQGAVAELRSRLRLREAFAAAPGPAHPVVDRDALRAWAQAPAAPLPTAFRWLAPLLVSLTFVAAWRYAAVHSPLALLAMLVLDASLTFRYQRVFKPLFAQAEQAREALRAIPTLLGHMERESFATPLLQSLQAGLRADDARASDGLGRLARLAQWAEARNNYVVRLLDAPVLYSLQLALQLERWRRRFGAQLDSWLRALAAFETLLSLAGYSFDHPEDPFPEFSEGASLFRATGLGHPLLPSSRCVRNDVSLGGATQLLLVSGSNMSGKSTLLRSVGVNAVLAFAGAPVRAQSLVLSPLTLGASIQVNDSLQAGRSRFYAEILRLRALAEAARAHPPTLFLIDEVLAGTNSSDRLAGARGLVRELLRSGAIGILSTHDLALTSLAAEASAHNVHFQDEVVEGQLRFDYTLRDGPVQRSNGLALMRLIGLDV